MANKVNDSIAVPPLTNLQKVDGILNNKSPETSIETPISTPIKILP